MDRLVAGCRGCNAALESYYDALLHAGQEVLSGRAAVEWVMSGGTGEEAWSVRGVCVLETREGKISRATDYWDKK